MKVSVWKYYLQILYLELDRIMQKIYKEYYTMLQSFYINMFVQYTVMLHINKFPLSLCFIWRCITCLYGSLCYHCMYMKTLKWRHIHFKIIYLQSLLTILHIRECCPISPMFQMMIKLDDIQGKGCRGGLYPGVGGT